MKNIWIMNHYATDNYYNEGGRHYWLAENLKKEGYKVTIFCANTRHNSDDFIDTQRSIYTEKVVNEIPFVFIKSKPYSRNNYNRILNILSFTKRLLSVTKKYAKIYGKPNLILASSVHPLTLLAGIRIAKRWNINCITEIRDLWPESIVAYNIISEKNPISKLMYSGEKWIYKKSDSIIMTWQGGYDYIKNKGWLNQISKDKIHHISNGVVLEDFEYNSINYQVQDSDLDNTNKKNFVYTGSIRKVNDLEFLVKAAKIVQEKANDKNIMFIIYGDGEEKKPLEELVRKWKLNNIIFKDKVPKNYVPYILKKSYVNILHNKSTNLDKYGQSQNKFFEYLAAGKPILQTYSTGYSIIEKYNCGVCVNTQTPDNIANAIIKMAEEETEMKFKGKNAKNIAPKYDFENLTKQLIEVIEKN